MLVERYHDISCGHRVLGHKLRNGDNGPCSRIHGHNYRITFYCSSLSLNQLGMVIDFSEIKYRLCSWLEENWDHKMLLSVDDPWLPLLKQIDSSIVEVPFNPTAENMAEYLIKEVGPAQLKDTIVTLVKCTVSETRKCSATCSL